MKTEQKNIVIAVTGASGAIYAKILFEKLNEYKTQINDVGVVFSDNAKQIWEEEIGDCTYKNIPFKIYNTDDFYAPFASGSSQYNIMIICPCSMGTLARIANGFSDDLISRAADVILKERRKLILITREAPLNLIHIKNMKRVTKAGGIICPANPVFYHKPSTIEELVCTVIDRVLDLSDIKINANRWSD